MSEIFFTSDHHFGHANIIRFCNRPFENAKQMNEVLIQKWNEKIGPNDMVYHLGDLELYSEEDLADIIDQLNGTIHLIVGDHEGAAVQNKKKFQWVKDYYELKAKDPDKKNGVQRIMLFHYAMRSWRGAHHGNWHLYGHSHGTLPDLEDQLCFDVGVDCHDFYPLAYEDV
ncbi:MAG: calcineurin-like phosphoesterase family protein [Glaciecola sp.]|jgi:calcineurin-like phosphoesterase family protein